MKLLISRVGLSKAVGMLTYRWPSDLSMAVRGVHGVFSGSPESLISVLQVLVNFDVFDESGVKTTRVALRHAFQKSIESRPVVQVSDAQCDDGGVLVHVQKLST